MGVSSISGNVLSFNQWWQTIPVDCHEVSDHNNDAGDGHAQKPQIATFSTFIVIQFN
jgi:hypothetical protein